MREGIFVKTYPAQPFDRREILRYAGCKEEIEELSALLDDTLAECKDVFCGRVCYRVFTAEDFFTLFGEESVALNKNLANCQWVLIFAATVGLDIDRLTTKYANADLSKAVFMQAIGAERIESLCDVFCEDIKQKAAEKGWYTRPRFSAGYGDFPLEKQKMFFETLDCARKIGVSLTDSYLMTPTKSVTAVVGFSKEKKIQKTGCASCDKRDCASRR